MYTPSPTYSRFPVYKSPYYTSSTSYESPYYLPSPIYKKSLYTPSPSYIPSNYEKPIYTPSPTYSPSLFSSLHITLYSLPMNPHTTLRQQYIKIQFILLHHIPMKNQSTHHHQIIHHLPLTIPQLIVHLLSTSLPLKPKLRPTTNLIMR